MKSQMNEIVLKTRENRQKRIKEPLMQQRDSMTQKQRMKRILIAH